MSERNTQALAKVLRRYVDKLTETTPALLGDGKGHVKVPGTTDFVYARVGRERLLMKVRNRKAANMDGLPVRLKTSIGGALYVFDTDQTVTITGGGENPEIGPHAQNHALNGSDPVWISSSQVTNGLAYVKTGMVVHVNAGWVIAAGKATKTAPADVDMTAQIPATGARWGLLRASLTGTLSLQLGTTVDSVLELDTSMMPTAPTGYAPIAAIRLYAGQVALSKTVTAPDVIDLRFSPHVSGAATASTVAVDTTNFGGNLTGLDDTVQKALETLDQMSGGGGGGGGDPTWFADGRIAVATAVGGAWVSPRSHHIDAVYLVCLDKGTAGSTIIDVNLNGTTIFTTQANRPTLTYDDSNGWAKGTPDIHDTVEGDIVTIDIDQVATDAGRWTVLVSLASYDGTKTFIGLSDTPSDYLSAAKKMLQVNAAGTAVEFTPRSEIRFTFASSTTSEGNARTRTSGSYATHGAEVSISRPVLLTEVRWDIKSASTYTLKIKSYYNGMTLHTFTDVVVAADNTLDVLFSAPSGGVILGPGTYYFELTPLEAKTWDDAGSGSPNRALVTNGLFVLRGTWYGTGTANYIPACRFVYKLGSYEYV